MTVGTAAPASAAPSNDAWYRLRVCESGNNYRINTGNGYYGAYQFNLGTWRAYGGSGRPSDAPPAEQDYRAKLLYQARGWAPWPACARRLGLRNDPSYGAVTSTTRATRASRSARRAPVAHLPAGPAARPAARPERSHPTAAPVRWDARVVVWASPDGGRWGRSATVLIGRVGAWAAVVRVPTTSFRYQLRTTRGSVRAL